jgi:hypothetical protein
METKNLKLMDMLTPEQIEQLKGLNIKTIEAHFSNPIYLKADAMAQEVRRDQIIKGAQKYDEPLNPASWTPKQLIQHAFQENIDQQHYLAALQEKFEAMERELQAVSGLYKREIEKMGELTEFLVKTFPDAGNAGDHCIDIAIELIKELKAQNENLKMAQKVTIVNVQNGIEFAKEITKFKDELAELFKKKILDKEKKKLEPNLDENELRQMRERIEKEAKKRIKELEERLGE